jgi:RNA polymerase sigma-70 factor (ECF subfamily)
MLKASQMVYSSGQGRLRLVTPAAAASHEAEEAALARALIEGQANAPELAWDRYAPLVHGIVSRALGPDAEVEDVTQEIFYRLFARIGSLRKPEALRSFVVSFAVRIVKWELRRRRARRWLTLSETGDVPDDQLLFMNVDNRYALRRLYSLLNLLSTRERLVLVLRHVEGMTLEEIAEAMEISLATVKRTLRHASTRLSELVDADVQLRPKNGTSGASAKNAEPGKRRSST